MINNYYEDRIMPPQSPGGTPIAQTPAGGYHGGGASEYQSVYGTPGYQGGMSPGPGGNYGGASPGYGMASPLYNPSGQSPIY